MRSTSAAVSRLACSAKWYAARALAPSSGSNKVHSAVTMSAY
jgi:hypothetical protein